MHVSKKHGIDLLLIPPISYDNFWKNTNFIPIGLLSIYSNLRLQRFSARIFTLHERAGESQEINTIADQVIEYNPQLIGFSTWCSSYPFVLQLSNIIRSKVGIPILLGGPQASIVASETLEYFPSIDYILRGEADHSIIQLLNFLTSNKRGSISDISGLTYRNDNGEIISNSITYVEEELDNLPVPAYDQLDKTAGYRIDAGRGCPHKCNFCTTNEFFSRKPRTKSPKRIIMEMDYCNKHARVNTFGLAHDMLTLNKKFIDSFCRNLINHASENGHHYKWTCSARTDSLRKESLQKMAKSGCRDIFFGIESGSEKIQKGINKNLDLEHAEEIIEASSKYGIRPTVSFMTGFPKENEEDLEKSLKLIVKMAILGAKPQMTMLSILPGTPMHKEHIDELKFDTHFSGFSNALLTDMEIELVKSSPEIFSSFYFLPNKTLPRTLLTFVVGLVNFIPDFLLTVRLLQKYINKELPNISLLDYIKYGLKSYKEEKDIPEPEYFFLTNSLKEYLIYCSNLKNGSPDYIWDVFNGDCLKAYLKIKYYRHIQEKVDGTSIEPQLTFQHEGSNYELNSILNVLRTKYDISVFYRKNGLQKQNFSDPPEKGEYAFLILNESGKVSKMFKLTKNQSDLLEHVTNSENRNDNINHLMKKNEIRTTIDELIRIKALTKID